MKKITLIMAFALIGLNANVFGQTFTYNGINYEVINTSPNEVKVGNNRNFQGAAVIPVSVQNSGVLYSVTAIGPAAFLNCSGLTSVIIPNSVMTIGNYAFQSCSGLTALTIPNSVTTIEYFAFTHSGLIALTIPNSVTTIDNNAFYQCHELATIDVDANNPNYSSNNGILYDKLQETLVCCPIGKTGALTIHNSVTTIGFGAFSFCSGLTTITIPNSVTTIGDSAFLDCSGLISVTIGSSITTIGCSTFYSCSGLTSINVDANNPNYSSNDGILYNKLQDTLFCCPIGKTAASTIPNSVTTIGDNAFYACSGLTSLTCNAVIPPSLGANVFTNVPNGIPVYVHCRSLTAYQTSWTHFNNFQPLPTDTNFISSTICNGTVYTANGFNVSTEGIHSLTIQNANGCDSIIKLNLSVYPVVDTTFFNATICNGTTYSANGFNASTTGIYSRTEQNANGCDSIIVLNLSVYAVVDTVFINEIICNGTTYSANGFNATATGVYALTVQNANGCNSTIVLNLSVYPIVDTAFINAAICNGRTYSANGFNESTEGVHYLTVQNANGCDSTIVLNLSVYPVIDTTFINATITAGEAYTDNGFNETAAGIYQLILQDVNGCDSVIVLNLSVNGNSLTDVEATNFNIYPNPAKDKLFIEGEGFERVIVYDVLGKEVLTSNKKEIDISSLPNGVYNVNILQGGKTIATRKIVKQ